MKLHLKLRYNNRKGDANNKRESGNTWYTDNTLVGV